VNGRGARLAAVSPGRIKGGEDHEDRLIGGCIPDFGICHHLAVPCQLRAKRMLQDMRNGQGMRQFLHREISQLPSATGLCV
jgi:hypothetical protein